MGTKGPRRDGNAMSAADWFEAVCDFVLGFLAAALVLIAWVVLRAALGLGAS